MSPGRSDILTGGWEWVRGGGSGWGGLWTGTELEEVNMELAWPRQRVSSRRAWWQ